VRRGEEDEREINLRRPSAPPSRADSEVDRPAPIRQGSVRDSTAPVYVGEDGFVAGEMPLLLYLDQNYLSGMVKRKPGFRELEPALRGVADDRDAVEAEFVEHRQQVAFVIRITVRVVVLAESVTAEVERDYPRAGEKRTTRSQYPALQDVGVAYCVTDTRTEYRSQGSSSSGSVLLHNPRDQAIVRVRGLNQHDKR